METQYQKLINEGHSPSEAANETIEEETESLNPFCQMEGAAGLIGACSTTAQRGALDLGPQFKAVIAPVLAGAKPGYNGSLIVNPRYTVTQPNMWDVMETVRELRPGK
jgi:hypothetical protein